MVLMLLRCMAGCMASLCTSRPPSYRASMRAYI